MLPVTHSALIVPTDQEYEEDKAATAMAVEELGSSLAQENHPFCGLSADIFLTCIVFRLKLEELIALRGVSKACRSIAHNLCVKREVVCESWGFGVWKWNAFLGKVTNPPLPLSCVERVFAKIIETDPYASADERSFVFQKYVFYFAPEKVNEQDYTFECLRSLLEDHKTKLEIDDPEKIGNLFFGRASWILMRKTADKQRRDLREGDQIGSPLDIATGITLIRLTSDNMIHKDVQSSVPLYVCETREAVSIGHIYVMHNRMAILPILRV